MKLIFLRDNNVIKEARREKKLNSQSSKKANNPQEKKLRGRGQ
jgi:hypothetical protein